MKIDLNDPRITAFALGELKGRDAVEMARAVRQDERVRAAVDEVRATSGLLMDTLGGGQLGMLTTEQREAVRSAGAMPVITDIKSARVPFWKKPAVAGIGAAAAVALTLYYVGGRPGGGAGGGGDSTADWSWAQVETDRLTAPAVHDRSGVTILNQGGGDNELLVAMSEDTLRFRQEVAQRVEGMADSDISSGAGLPELNRVSRMPWITAEAGRVVQVPLVSGVTSWPWIERSVSGQQVLPPHRAVRLEEMINHFRYKKASMISGGGLVADMEICRHPWHSSRALLAVHVGVEGETISTAAQLTVNTGRVKQLRLLGYAGVNDTAWTKAGNGTSHGPVNASRSHGNYVIYELELGDQDDGPIATLSLGKGTETARLPVGSAVPWAQASPDLRFASTVMACGLLLNGEASTEGLSVQHFEAMVNAVEKQDVMVMGSQRRQALQVFRQSAALATGSGGE